jgi:hypothetical protein
VAGFGERLDELSELVGHGTLEGSVVVDQAYAAAQHEHLEYRHVRGGQAKYLEQPLHTEHGGYLRAIAEQLLEEGPVPGMVDAMENLSDKVEELAPREFENLRESGHPTVTSDGAVVYDRAPKQRRLTQQELDEQRRHGQRHRHLHPEQYEPR